MQSFPAPLQIPESSDIVSLLLLFGRLGTLRNDPHAWRMKLLESLREMLHASAAAAFTLHRVGPQAAPAVASLTHVGFTEHQRRAFLLEFGTAPFADPFSRRAIEQFILHDRQTFTISRTTLLEDALWHADPHVRAHRPETLSADALLSLQAGAPRSTGYALYLFGHAASALGAAPRFTERDRSVLHLLHMGLQPLYGADEAGAQIARPDTLRPRLRETLDHLLAGATEREVAEKMGISVHTVHDYVKALYQHFDVSSRAELLSRWIQAGHEQPRR